MSKRRRKLHDEDDVEENLDDVEPEHDEEKHEEEGKKPTKDGVLVGAGQHAEGDLVPGQGGCDRRGVQPLLQGHLQQCLNPLACTHFNAWARCPSFFCSTRRRIT